MVYRDRKDAGKRLAEKLTHYRDKSDVIVLGLPRGGVTVAYEVARALRCPLDILIARKSVSTAIRNWPRARFPRPEP
jgi:putative phosphoribosyl transferase